MSNSQIKVPTASHSGDVSSKASSSSSTDGVTLDFIERLGSLEKTFTEFDGRFLKANDKLDSIKAESDRLSEQNHRIESLVWGGLFGLILIVIGLLFSYFEYVSSDAMKYQSDLAKVQALEEQQKNSINDLRDKIITIEDENQDLYKVNSCLKKRKSWEMNLCFE